MRYQRLEEDLKERQPKRTTKTAQKLTLFPDGLPEEEQKGSWIDNIERRFLPRGPYQNPSNDGESILGNHENSVTLEQNIDSSGQSIPLATQQKDLAKRIAPIGEILYFDYGVVVCWGFTLQEEISILQDLKPFEDDSLSSDEQQTEQFYFHYNTFHQPRIFNDIITLKNPSNFMLKITISHAVAQSVKLTLFEGRIDETIEKTKLIPHVMAEEGKINMNRLAINQKIGQLFVMRINVNLVSNVLDTPEIFWSEPALQPLYQAIRGYLEISQRVELLNQRVAVISDLLSMLKEHLNSTHNEQLEWIVIALIGTHFLYSV